MVSDRSSGVKIGVVGPCGAGKSTLVRALRARGVAAREIAQEHSGAPAMWQRITHPDLLVYLDASRETAERRLERELPPDWWEEMSARLAHARAHADLIVETDDLTPEEIAARVAEFLAAVGETAFATQ
ncbi:MAG: hypothetical protein ACUVXE_09615 [Anaerolineae bacterium]